MKINFKIFLLILTFAFVCISQVEAIECTTYADCRYQGTPIRNTDGSIHRDWKVISEYRKLHPCPSTGLTTGACPNWALNHNCPIACGCRDTVWNLTWMRNDVKKIVDSYERKINASTPPQPDTAACVNQIVK